MIRMIREHAELMIEERENGEEEGGDGAASTEASRGMDGVAASSAPNGDATSAPLYESPKVDPVVRASSSRRAPLDRPNIDVGCTPAAWTFFMARWEAFRTGSDLPRHALTANFLACLSESLFASANRAIADLASLDLTLVEDIVKGLAVTPVDIAVHRCKMLLSRRQHGETFRAFYVRLCGLATDCEFADQVIALVLCHSENVFDEEIRKELWSMTTEFLNSPQKVVTFVEAQEEIVALERRKMARDTASRFQQAATSSDAAARRPRTSRRRDGRSSPHLHHVRAPEQQSQKRRAFGPQRDDAESNEIGFEREGVA